MENPKNKIPTQKEIDATVAYLTEVQEHEGWKIIVKGLEDRVTVAESILHGETPLGKGETIEFWQKIWQDRKNMIELPSQLIEGLQSGQIVPKEFDPYEK